jgi:hypothetical protein
VSASVRYQIVDFISCWKQRSGLRDNWFCRAFALKQEKLIALRKRYGLPGQHNGSMPTSHLKINSLAEITKYMKERGKRFMWPD